MSGRDREPGEYDEPGHVAGLGHYQDRGVRSLSDQEPSASEGDPGDVSDPGRVRGGGECLYWCCYGCGG